MIIDNQKAKLPIRETATLHSRLRAQRAESGRSLRESTNLYLYKTRNLVDSVDRCSDRCCQLGSGI